MAKTIQMRTPQQEKEARLVAGMYDKNRKKTVGTVCLLLEVLLGKLPWRVLR